MLAVAFHASCPGSSPPFSPRYGPPSLLPRTPEAPVSRHIAAAVASSGKSPGSPSLSRFSTRGTSASQSSHSLATSPLQISRTLPPPTRTPASSSSPSPRFSTAAPNAQTSPSAPPRSRAAPRPGHPTPSSPESRRRGAEPPPAILLRGPASSGHLPSCQAHLQVRLSPLLLFPTLALAAGDPSRRNRRSKPLPLL